jgi:hypothetical protein
MPVTRGVQLVFPEKIAGGLASIRQVLERVLTKGSGFEQSILKKSNNL